MLKNLQKTSVMISVYIKYAFMFVYFRYMDIDFNSGSILCMMEKTESRHTNYRRTLNWTFKNVVIIIVKWNLYMMSFSPTHTYNNRKYGRTLLVMHKQFFGLLVIVCCGDWKPALNCDCYYPWILLFAYVNSCK